MDQELEDLRRLAALEEAEKASAPESLLGKAAGMAKRGGSSLMTGFGKTTGGIMSAFGQKDTPLEKTGNRVSEYWKEFGEANGMKPGLARSAVEGAGGGLVLPMGMPAQAGRSLLSSIAGGAGGGVGADLGSRFIPKFNIGGKEVDIGALLGGLVGGAAGAYPFAPRQSVAEQDIRGVVKDLPPEVWTAAQGRASNFQDVGAKTATAADALPNLIPLASKAANAKGANQLTEKLVGREADLQGLGDKFIERIGPRAEPAVVANQTADAANAFLSEQKALRGEALGNLLAGKTITSVQARELYDSLIAAAKAQTVPAKRQAYLDVAKQIVGTDKRPLQNVQDLSLQIKALKDSVKNPLALNSGAAQITAGYMKEPIRAAEAGLEAVSPDFATGMADFRKYSGSLEKLAEGPIGRLADRNPLSVAATPVGRLNTLMDGTSPQTIEGTMRQLSSPVMAGGKPVNPRDIASAIAQQRLKAGSTNPGQAVRGLPGSMQEEQTAALLRAGGNNPQQTMAPLRAADDLQGLTAASSNYSVPRMGWGNAIRPFRALDMALTAKSTEAVNREVGRLLADPANLPKLREIAQFDPMVRRALTLKAAVTPGLVNQPEN